MSVRGTRYKPLDEYGPSLYEECGTYSGWNRHRREKTTVCFQCQTAANNYLYEWRHRNRHSTSRSVFIPDDGLTDDQLVAGALELEREGALNEPFETVRRIIEAVFPNEEVPIEKA